MTHRTYHISKVGKSKNRKLGGMRRQRNMFQTKKQDKTPEGELSEVEISSLPDKEFK